MDDVYMRLNGLFKLSSSYIFGIFQDEIIYMNPRCRQAFPEICDEKDITKVFAHWPFEVNAVVSTLVFGREIVVTVSEFDGILILTAEKAHKKDSICTVPPTTLYSMVSSMTTLRFALDKICGLCEEGEKSTMYSSIIYHNYFKLLRNTEHLTLISHLEKGTYPQSVQLLELGTFLSDIVSSVRFLTDENSLTINYAPPTDLITVNADSNLIEKMILAVISNSIKNTPSGGVIDVRVYRRNSAVVIAVNDTGGGIEPQILGSIFNNDLEVENDRIPELNRGLGLFMASKIANLHNGTMLVNSRENVGTTVRIMLRARTGFDERNVLRAPEAKYGNPIPQTTLTELADVLKTEKYSSFIKRSPHF